MFSTELYSSNSCNILRMSAAAFALVFQFPSLIELDLVFSNMYKKFELAT